MKKIITILVLFISAKCFSQTENNFMQKNTFHDSVYFKVVPYNSGAGMVHLALDTVVASPTFGKLVRKTASALDTLTISTRAWRQKGVDSVIGVIKAHIFSKGMTLESPGAAESFGMWQTQVAITVSSIKAVVVGSGSPSVTINIAFGTDRTSGTNVFSAGTAITNTTTGQTINSGFNDATIPAGSFIWFTSSAQSGTVTQIEVTINYTED